MTCKHAYHDVVIKNDTDQVALTYKDDIILGNISYLAYDEGLQGCLILDWVDSQALTCVPDSDDPPIQIMIFDGFGISKIIGYISIYENSISVGIQQIKAKICYQFNLTGQKLKEEDHNGMVRNPITGRWSFL